MVQNKTLVSIIKIMLIFLIALIILALLAILVILPKIIKGKETEVPNLVGKTKDECITILREHNLQLDLNIEDREDPLVEDGFVIEQDPPAGSEVKTGKRVHIVVSRGAQQVEVPNVVGKSLEDAESIINSAYLKVGYQARAHSKHYPKPGTVIAQTPLAGSLKSRGSSISLLISLGTHKEVYVVPNLTNMQFAEVRMLLNKYHLKVGKVVYNSKTSTQSGIVLSHLPRDGQLITVGEAINFEVSGIRTAQVSEEKPRAVVINYTVPESDENEPVHITIVVEDSLGSERVIDGNYYPGTLIQRPYTVTGDAVMKVYGDDTDELIYEEEL